MIGKMKPARNWAGTFVVIRRGKSFAESIGKSKSSPADVITWEGTIGGKQFTVVSTVRLVLSNLAHFMVHSAERITGGPARSNGRTGSYSLKGGYYVDLVVTEAATERELVAIGRLAAEADERLICVRRKGERLSDARETEGRKPAPSMVRS